MENLLSNVLETTFFNIIIIGAALSILYGLWLIISPKSALTLNHKINKGFSMRKASKPLEKPIYIERWFYRHSNITGGLLMIGALYLLYLLFWQLDFILLAKKLSGLTPLMWEWLLQSFHIFFASMAIVVFLIGFLIIIRPSLLKPLEEKANKWVSTRQKMQFMSDDIVKADKLLDRFPRQFGSIIIVAGSIVLLNMDKFNV
jgi:hypothetical protein